MRIVLAAVLFAGVSMQAAVAGPAPKPMPSSASSASSTAIWIGVFDPKLPLHAPWDNAKLTAVAHAGAVRVLTPSSGPAASGDVVVVHPLLAKTAAGRIEKGEVALADFAFDQRDGDDGVIVLPAGTAVAFVAPGKADAAAILTTLVNTDALAKVRRAVAGTELGGVDLDGDGKPDVVATYGCSAWFDGSCQSKGQFVLARRGGRWSIIE